MHPGYGFLSERADFAEAVIDAGLTWVGPNPKTIAMMGSKLEAKARMAEAGIPMLPHLDRPGRGHRVPGDGQGVRGRRRPRHADRARPRTSLAEAIASARREAAAAFGDGTVFCERYVERARHIEVQIMADSEGNVVTFGERECSIQRRHQKIIEETPSPVVSQSMRAQLCDAAIAVAQAVGYVGAGTVEFLVAPSGEFFFLEMNTRLQVEHAITECVIGMLDLVRLQILVAEGGTLPFDGRAAAARARDRGPALRRGSGARLAAVDRHAAPLPRARASTRSSGR